MWILCNNHGKTFVYLKPHDAVQRPRVSRYGLKTFVCISWNSSGVLHGRLLEMSLMLITTNCLKLLTNMVPTVTRHRKIAGVNVCKTLLVSTRQIKEKTAILHWIVTLSATHPYSSNMASNDVHLFHSLQHFLAAKLFNDPEEVKICLNYYFA